MRSQKRNSRYKRSKQFQVRANGKPIKYLACLSAAIRNVHEALISGYDYVELADRESNTLVCYDKATSSIYSKVLNGRSLS